MRRPDFEMGMMMLAYLLSLGTVHDMADRLVMAKLNEIIGIGGGWVESLQPF